MTIEVRNDNGDVILIANLEESADLIERLSDLIDTYMREKGNNMEEVNM